MDRAQDDLKEAQERCHDLEDSEKEHKAVAGDMRVFVEVMTTLCQDRRSDIEIRASEEKLRRELHFVKDKVRATAEGLAVVDQLRSTSFNSAICAGEYTGVRGHSRRN